MSGSDASAVPQRAVALQYDGGTAAPVVVAAGMGYLAEKIVEVAAGSGVPVYEDNSLATLLSQLELGQEIPEALYQAIVEIYVYFLEFDPSRPQGLHSGEARAPSAPEAAPAQTEGGGS